MSAVPSSPQPTAPVASDMLVTDDGEIIRVTIHRATWVLPKEIARIVRAQRAKHSGVAADALLQGFLLAGEIAHEMEKTNGGAING